MHRKIIFPWIFIWRDLFKPPQRRQCLDPRPLLIVSLDSFRSWTWARFQTGGAYPTPADVFIYFLYTVFITLHVCVIILWPLRFSWLFVLGFYKEDYLQIFKGVSFWLHGFCGQWEGWDPVNRFNHTSWVAIVTSTDRHKSARNRCVMEVFGGVFVLWCCFLNFSVGVGYFVIGLSQIYSFFSFNN